MIFTPPLVSIIIPVYNRPKEFERALISAFSQDYQNIEIIVIDDGSEDDIGSVIEKNKDKSPFTIQYLRQENQGPGGARSTGLAHASGVFIQYLDADDTIDPKKISLQVNALLSTPSAVVCFSGRTNNDYSTDLLELALNASPWSTTSALWRYPDKKIALWPSFIGGEDIVHNVLVGLHSREIVWIDEKLVKLYASQISHSKLSKTGDKRERRLNDNYAFPIYLYKLLVEFGLISENIYREPLAERLYRISFQFAMVGERKKALDLLKHAYRATSMLKKKIEVIIAYLIIYLTRAKVPFFYITLFKIHRKINPKSLHADKYISTLI